MDMLYTSILVLNAVLSVISSPLIQEANQNEPVKELHETSQLHVIEPGEQTKDTDIGSLGSKDQVPQQTGLEQDKHGRVMMGVKQTGCDDGKWNLQIDWDVPDGKDQTYMYTCQPEEQLMMEESKKQQAADTTHGPESPANISQSDRLFTPLNEVKEDCLDRSQIPRPGHACMANKIVYEDTPPRAGNHRPLWPAFGEYRYLPPARWVHALEHGAAVFLYHPCADPVRIELMKLMAKSCIRKHLITPYRDMKHQFAIVTYGCRIEMNSFDPEVAHEYIKQHALVDAPETTPRNGSFVAELIDASDVIKGSDIYDTCICPYWSSLRNSLETYMSWYRSIEIRVSEARDKNQPVNLTGISMGDDIDVERTENGCPLS